MEEIEYKVSKNKDISLSFLQNINYHDIINSATNFADINNHYLINKVHFIINKNSEDIKSDLLYRKNQNHPYEDHKKDIKFRVPLELNEYYKELNNFCIKNKLFKTITNIEAKTVEKLIIGLGNSNVKETSMTLHHIYGIPYIPGQVLKGIFKKSLDIDFKADEYKDLYQLLFGGKKTEPQDNNANDNIIFFDAFPINNYTISKDIMTVHYSGYYNGNKPPSDASKIIPISFYVVKDTQFDIAFALKENKLKEMKIIDVYKKVVKVLNYALSENGIGAKKSSGYGYFKIKNIKTLENEILEQEEKIKKDEFEKLSFVDREYHYFDEAKNKDEYVSELVKKIECNNDISIEDKKSLATLAMNYYSDKKNGK